MVISHDFILNIPGNGAIRYCWIIH